MKWQPFIQFRCGHDQESWERLTPEEQKAAYRASGKRRKVLSSIVEDQGDPIAVEEQSSLPIRLVTKAEFERMPVYQQQPPGLNDRALRITICLERAIFHSQHS
jgi:hypothetical protein